MEFLQLLPGAIYELSACAIQRGTITKADRYGLMAAILNESLAEEERYIIDRLLRALLRGRLRIIDELSAVM